MDNIFEKEKGFTLLEMLISIMVITIGVLGIYSAVLKYTKATQVARENLTAAYLGQEGIEIIKNIRDTNWINAETWNDDLTGCDAVDGSCEIDTIFGGGTAKDPVFTIWSGSGRSLYIENSTKLYKYLASPGASDIRTIYTRKITIDSVTDDVLKIQVDVYWRGKTTTVKEDIYNWNQ